MYRRVMERKKKLNYANRAHYAAGTLKEENKTL